MKMKQQSNNRLLEAKDQLFSTQQQLEQLQEMKTDKERDIKQLREQVAALDSKLSLCGDVSNWSTEPA